jgi:hypothetical protein
MPTARHSSAAAAFDGKIYVMGGTGAPPNGDGSSAIVEVYDPATDSWTRLGGMPVAVHGIEAAAWDDKVYAFGGRWEDEALEYSPATDSWRWLSPEGGVWFSHPRVARIADRIYVMGGFGPPMEASGKLYVYDPVGNRLTRLPDVPTHRRYCGLAASSNALYAAGGFLSDQESTAAMESFVITNPLAKTDENNSVTISGVLTDPSCLDVHQVLMSWGDGTEDTVIHLAVGERSFEASHRYLDDAPNDTAPDKYTITATATDDDRGRASPASMTINRAARGRDGGDAKVNGSPRGSHGERRLQ